MMDTSRKVALVVADRARDEADCRELLDMLGLLAERPQPKRKPGRPPVDHGHGDYRTYIKGCRCTDCREDHRRQSAERRAVWAKDPSAADRAGHGKSTTYDYYGCRCIDCCEANRLKGRRNRVRRETDPAAADRAGHGKRSTYNNYGCRCEACRAAYRSACARERAARAQDPMAADRAGHGKTSTYRNYACRCDECRAANTAAVNASRARRRARMAEVAS